MTHKEKKRGRLMFLLPLMLALTGLAFLLFNWVLQFSTLDALSDLKQLMQRNWYILLLPLIFLVLYLIKVPPLGAYIGAGVAAVCFLIQLIVALILFRSGKQADGLVQWVPAHTLLQNVQAAIYSVSLEHVLALLSDLCLLVANLSAVFSCLGYVQVKNESDLRQARAARREKLLQQQQQEEQVSEEAIG